MAKPLFWLGPSLDDLRAFPPGARRMAGFQLRRVQQGLEPTGWKSMPGIGTGVQEIRIHTGREHRIFYLARFAERVYVLDAFEKRTRRTPKRDLAVAGSHLRDLLAKRGRRDHAKE